MPPSPEFPLTQTSSGDRAVCSLRAWGTWGLGVLVSSVSAAFTHLPPPTPGRSFPASPVSGSLGWLPGPPLLGRSWSPPSLLSTMRWLIVSPQPVWAECWVRFLTSGLTRQACARLFVSTAQGTLQSCVSQPPLLDFFPSFSSQSRLCSDAPREGAALSVSSSLTGLRFCLKSWIVAA